MADYKRYLEKKALGLSDMIKLNGSFALSFKKFDAETGEAITPEVQAIGREELEAEKLKLQADISDIDGILAEMDKLEVV